MNAMDEDLNARFMAQEWKKLPRCPQIQANFEIHDAARFATLNEVLNGEHERAEAELKIYRGLEVFGPANLEDSPRAVECRAHRLLHHHCRVVGKRSEDRFMRLRWRAQIEDGSGHGNGLFQRAEYAREVELLRPFLSDFRIEIEHAGHGEASLAIGGQVRVADDVARTDDDDRSRLGGPRPGLGKLIGI